MPSVSMASDLYSACPRSCCGGPGPGRVVRHAQPHMRASGGLKTSPPRSQQCSTRPCAAVAPTVLLLLFHLAGQPRQLRDRRVAAAHHLTALSWLPLALSARPQRCNATAPFAPPFYGWGAAGAAPSAPTAH